jgi:hypothetical protein
MSQDESLAVAKVYVREMAEGMPTKHSEQAIRLASGVED